MGVQQTKQMIYTVSSALALLAPFYIALNGVDIVHYQILWTFYLLNGSYCAFMIWILMFFWMKVDWTLDMWSMITFLFPLHTQSGFDISSTHIGWDNLVAMYRRLPVVQSVMQ